MTLFIWALTALSIIGVVLNARKKISGFYFWAVANVFWAVVNALQGQHAQAVLFGFYFVASVYGIWVWKKDLNHEPHERHERLKTSE